VVAPRCCAASAAAIALSGVAGLRLPAGGAMCRHMVVSASAFRAALGAFATGVCVVATRDPAGRPAAVTVNSFTSVSLDPPLVLFCLDRRGSALARFEAAPAWSVHVLADGQEELARRFARRSQEALLSDPWAGLSWSDGEDGLPVFPGCLARLSCRAERVADGGDHSILIGRVAALDWRAEGRPLLYFRGRFEAVAERVAA